MVNRDEENQSLQEVFQEDEAGVADLLELYGKVEQIYIAASQATNQSQIIHDSTSTNM